MAVRLCYDAFWFWIESVVRTCGVSIFFFQAEDGIRDVAVTGVQTCALPIYFVLHQLQRRASSVDRIGIFGLDADRQFLYPRIRRQSRGIAEQRGQSRGELPPEIGRASCRERV